MSKGKNKRTFTVEVDGKELKLAVLRPSAKQQQQGMLVHGRAFRDAARPDDGKKGTFVRKALDGVLREQNVWDDFKQKELERLQASLFEKEYRLAKGGIKKSEGRALAIAMRQDRRALAALTSESNAYDAMTADAMAENARFNYLVSACTVDAETGKPYWSDEESYFVDDSPAGLRAPNEMANLLYDLDDEWEKKLPENAFLLKHGFVNDKLELIDEKGRRIGEDGRLLDDKGRTVNEQGELIDRFGRALTETGEYKVVALPFLDEE